jgi:hypothetical protein
VSVKFAARFRSNASCRLMRRMELPASMRERRRTSVFLIEAERPDRRDATRAASPHFNLCDCCNASFLIGSEVQSRRVVRWRTWSRIGHVCVDDRYFESAGRNCAKAACGHGPAPIRARQRCSVGGRRRSRGSDASPTHHARRHALTVDGNPWAARADHLPLSTSATGAAVMTVVRTFW